MKLCVRDRTRKRCRAARRFCCRGPALGRAPSLACLHANLRLSVAQRGSAQDYIPCLAVHNARAMVWRVQSSQGCSRLCAGKAIRQPEQRKIPADWPGQRKCPAVQQVKDTRLTCQATLLGALDGQVGCRLLLALPVDLHVLWARLVACSMQLCQRLRLRDLPGCTRAWRSVSAS